MYSNGVSNLNDLPQASTGLQQKLVKVRNISNTRVVEVAPSGRRYDFDPGEVRDDVLAEDAAYLGQKQHVSGGCCGVPLRTRKYFEVEA